MAKKEQIIKSTDLTARILIDDEPLSRFFGFELYKKLKDSGFPQGGSGSFMQDPDSNEKVYLPLPSEVYGLFLADPKDWNKLRDAMVRVWLETHGEKAN